MTKMNILCMQALGAIQSDRTKIPQLIDTEEYKFLNMPTRSNYRSNYFDEKRRILYKLTQKQVKAIVNRIGIPELKLIDGIGPKRLQALFDYAKIEDFISPDYWLIHYTYFDQDTEININIAIKQSPALWLIEYLKDYPDHLVTLKMAIPITEEEYNLF